MALDGGDRDRGARDGVVLDVEQQDDRGQQLQAAVRPRWWSWRASSADVGSDGTGDCARALAAGLHVTSPIGVGEQVLGVVAWVGWSLPRNIQPMWASDLERPSGWPLSAGLDETGQRTERRLTPSMRISALPAEGSLWGVPLHGRFVGHSSANTPRAASWYFAGRPSRYTFRLWSAPARPASAPWAADWRPPRRTGLRSWPRSPRAAAQGDMR